MNKEECILFSKALIYATEKHAGQLRKDGSPYILHPIRVANMIAAQGFDVKYQIAGLFHDILEDVNEDKSVLENEISEYGVDVLDAVKLVSKNYNTKHYIKNILKNHMASVVKNADRIDNLNEAHLADEEFQKRYLENSKQYKGKFSKALDLSIDALTMSKKALYSLEETYLYQDIEKHEKEKTEEKIKQLLELKNRSEQPNKTDKSIIYFNFLNSVYCVRIRQYQIDKVWNLSEVGWVETDNYQYFLQEDMEPISRNTFENEMKEMRNKGYFCDFVDINEL